MLLVGNKIDLKEQRQVTYEVAEKLALSYDIEYEESSALKGQNVDHLFNLLTRGE